MTDLAGTPGLDLGGAVATRRSGQSPLESLADYHRLVLSGRPADGLHELGDLGDLGPLGGVLWDRSGWLPERFARLRTFLRQVLREWALVTSFKPESGLTRHQVAAAVGMLWGAEAYPHDAPQVVAAMRLGVDPRSVRYWRDRILYEADGLSAITDRTRSPAASPPAPQTHELWPRPERNGNWPQSAADQSYLLDKERVPPAAWRAVRDALDAEDGVRRPYKEGQHRLLSLIKLLTAQRTNAWLGGGRPGAGYNTWRQFADDVLEPWASLTTLRLSAREAPIIVDSKKKTGSTYRPAVAAAVQMFAFEVAADGEALKKYQAAESRRRAHVIAMVKGLGEDRAALNDPIRVLGLGDLRPSSAPRIEHAAASLALALRAGHGPPDAIQLKALADAVRGAPSADAKPPLIRNYLALRPRVVENARFDLEHELIGLADQSVGFDCVTCEDRRLVRALAEQRRRLPAGRRLAFNAHALRDEAIVHNKNNEFGAGRQALSDAEGQLQTMIREEKVRDAREGVEGGHQIWLAEGGVGVRDLEHSLDPSLKLRAVLSARSALRSSFLACTAFTMLDSAFDLTRPRHTDGYISTKAWEFQSRMIRLRVLIATRIALGMKLFSEAEVNHRLTALSERRYEMLPAPEPWEPMSRLSELKGEYRTILQIPGQQERDPVEFVRVALTLAFLCSGRIPLTAEADGSIMTKVRFLDAAPADIVSEEPEIALDLERACEWLHNRKTDAGVISWYARSSPLAKYLDRVSGGLYGQFRDIHDAHRPQTPSHD